MEQKKISNKQKLYNIYNHFHQSRNISEKRRLNPILQKIQMESYSPHIVQKNLGEDAAIIPSKKSNSTLSLITTDAILPEFVKKSPFGAGFSSIYVGIDDIIACGGNPTACSIIVAFPSHKIGNEIMRGILHGTKIFKVPLIRGHSITDSENLFLSSTIVGECPAEYYISSKSAQIGDFLAIVWDREGYPAKANPMYWDTITMKTSEEFYKKRIFFQTLAKKRLIHSSKDISNGGILGTLYQMMQYNGLGAKIELEQIEKAVEQTQMPYLFEDFLFSFLTSAFLISGSKENIDEIQKEIRNCKMEFTMIGTVQNEPEIYIQFYNLQKKLIKID
ncbi:AIR synthase related protein [Candidatus Harpocratesius sp.]